MREYATPLKKLAMKMNDRKASIEVDDLIQVGWIGMIEAWHRYDESFGVSFWGYAYSRVRGAMSDEVRAAKQFARSVKDDYRMEPFIDNVHDQVTTDKDPRFGNMTVWDDMLASLPDRDRQIVSLYVIRELALHRIGTLYGVSEGRIHQIVKVSMKKLRSKMQ